MRLIMQKHKVEEIETKKQKMLYDNNTKINLQEVSIISQLNPKQFFAQADKKQILAELKKIEKKKKQGEVK